MTLSYAQQAEFNRLLYGEGKDPEQEKTASFPQQLARGFVSGLTFGMVKPYKQAGVGQFPETLAHFAGIGLGFVPLARGVGAGVAAAGKVFPSLLRGGVTAGQAVTNIGKFAPYAENLSAAGRLATFGGATATGSVLEDALSGEPKTPGDLIKTGLIGAALGMGGEGLAMRLARGKSLSAKAAEAAGVKLEALPKEQTGKPYERFAEALAMAKDKLSGLQAQLAATPKNKKGTRNDLRNEINKTKNAITKFEQIAAEYGGAREIAAIGSRAISPPVAQTLPQALEGQGELFSNIASRTSKQVDEQLGLPFKQGIQEEMFPGLESLKPGQLNIPFGARIEGPSTKGMLDDVLGSTILENRGTRSLPLGRDILEPLKPNVGLTEPFGGLPEVLKGVFGGAIESKLPWVGKEVKLSTASQVGRPQVPQDIKELPLDVVKMKLRAQGYDLTSMPEKEMRNKLASIERSLAPGIGRAVPEPPSINVRQIPPEARLEAERAAYTEAAVMGEKQAWDFLREAGIRPETVSGMSLEQLRSAVLATKLKDVPVSGVFEVITPEGTKIIPAINPSRAGLTPAATELSQTFRISTPKLDLQRLDAGAFMTRQGKFSRLPEDLRLQLSVIDRSPFGDFNRFCL